MAGKIALMAPQIPPNIGELVHHLLVERKMTASRLADVAHISKATVYGLINGKKEPRLDTLQKIAEAMGFSWLAFLARVDGLSRQTEEMKKAPPSSPPTPSYEVSRQRARRAEDLLLQMSEESQKVAIRALEGIVAGERAETSASESFRSARFGVAERARTPELAIEEAIVAGPGQLSLLDMVAAAEPPPEPALT